MKKIYLLDGSAFIYRAFYAIGPLSTQAGLPTNAVYGFIRMLKKILDKNQPEYIAVVFDTGKPTFRHEQYEEYKAHRKPMPDEMSVQIPWIKKVVNAFRIPLIEMDGYEADDILATLAVRAEKKGYEVYILTSDKDMMQMVNPKIKIMNPAKDDFIYDAENVKKKYGVGPEKITTLLALTGDSSDNIQGVPGVGGKTAARLIKEYQNIDDIIKNSSSLSPKLKDGIQKYEEKIKENMDLVTLIKDVELDISVEDCKANEPDVSALSDIFREMEFKMLLRELLNNPAAAKEKTTKQIDNISSDLLEIKTPKEWSDIYSKLKKSGCFSITENTIAFKEGGTLKTVSLENLSNLEEKVWQDIYSIFKDPAVRKYGYDIKALLRNYIFKFKKESKGEYPAVKNIFDVYIASVLLNIKPIQEEGNVALQVYNIAPDLEKKLIDENLLNVYSRIELPLVEIIAGMEDLGIKIDVSILNKLSKTIEKDLSRLTAKIYKLADCEFNINSPKQLEVILFDKLGLPKKKRTKTGYSTDVGVLETLCKHHELPAQILEYRTLNKLKGTYIDALPALVSQKDSRIHTTFNQVGTATGRISSSNPNLQNIPIRSDLGKEIRHAFIPGKPNTMFLGVDYSQIELRVLAHLSGNKTLINAFSKDLDIHSITAKELFGSSDATKEMRRQAKVVNFGIIYGMGSRALAKNLGISVKDADKFISTYFKKYPGVAEYMDSQLKEAEEHGYVVTLFGRKRWIPELKSEYQQIRSFGQRAAINTPIQGTAADIIKLAMININNRIKRDNIQSDMLLQIHDELIFEVDEDSIEKLEACVKEEMESVVKLKVPLKVDIKAGRSWTDL